MKADLCYNMHLYITAWQKEMAKIQLEESKGKGGRHQMLTCHQVSHDSNSREVQLTKDILTGGMSFDCQLGPQKNSAQMMQYAAKWQNVNS